MRLVLARLARRKQKGSLMKGVLPRHCNLAKGTRGKALSGADRVCEVANPVIPTMLSAKPSIARSEGFVFYAPRARIYIKCRSVVLFTEKMLSLYSRTEW